jgi:hypothetical protein
MILRDLPDCEIPNESRDEAITVMMVLALEKSYSVSNSLHFLMRISGYTSRANKWFAR